MKIKALIICCIFIAGACSISTEVSGARFPAVIDANNPYNARMLKILGDNAEDRAGFSTAAGDINGDGREDLVFGAYTADGGRGITYVYFGSAATFNTGVKDLSSSLSGILYIVGAHFLDWSGYSVAVGNINGDAYDDVIIGAYKADPGGRINAGETYVIFGSASIHTRGSIDLSGSPYGVVRIYGKNTEDNAGFSVAAGYVNEDTYEDLIIGAYKADPEGRTDAGETYLIFGSSTFHNRGTIDLSGTPTGVARIYGETAGEFSGYSVAAGDINGDGKEDVVISAYGRFNGKGCTYVLPGTADIDTSTVIDFTDLPLGLVRAFGEDEDDNSGISVATGDINGDGYKDLIMGAPGGDPGGRYDAGEINVVFGGLTFQNKGAFFLNDLHADKLTIYGNVPSIPIGYSLAAGNLTGNGAYELIIGFPEGSPSGRLNAGLTYVLTGASNLKVRNVIDINDPPSDMSIIYGINPGDNSGHAVGAGDMDGDGYKDLVIGAHFSDPDSRNNAGSVYVIEGFGTTEVIYFTPPDESYASRYKDITMFFNSDISSVTVDVESQSGPVDGSLSWNLNSATFTPTYPLPPSNRVDVTVNGTNVEGEAIAQKTWHFFVKKNETPARILSHSPEANETNVAPDKDIVITFTGDIYPDSTTVLLTGINDRIITLSKSWADSILTLVNNNAFQLSETITITVSASDQYGDRSDSTWTFFVRPEIDPPEFTVEVTGGNPQHVPKNAHIHLIFPLDIDKTSVETTLEGSISGAISGTWTWSDTTYTFMPSQLYQPGEHLILTVSAADIHRNTVSDVISLPVRPDEIPPSIVSRSPEDGEANVGQSADIVVGFSEDVVRDSTFVSVISEKQGAKYHTLSWLDYTLTISGLNYILGDKLDVTVSVSDAYANRQEYSWTFYVREDNTPPYFSVISPAIPGMMDPDENITLVFPEDIDRLRVAASVKGGLDEEMPGTWAWSDSIYTFTSSSPYPLGYKLILTVNATDIHNNSIPETTHIFNVKPDEIPPTIRAHSPLAYAVNAPTDKFIVIEFSSDIYPALTYVTVSSNQRSSIPMNQAWTDSTLFLSPQTSLRENETVAVTVNLSDVYSNRSQYVWWFSTGPGLALSFYDIIVPGRPDMMGSFDPIKLVFSDIIDISSVTTLITGSKSGDVTGTWLWGEQNYTFIPLNGYRLGETLTVTVNARDIYKNSIPESSNTFTVKSDEEPPAITGRSPAPQSVEIAPYRDIVIEFTGDVLPDSTSISVTGDNNRTISMVQSWADSTVTLINDKSFRLKEVITISVGAGDYWGNRMQESWTFTVKETEIPPEIVFHSPSKDEKNVDPGANIVVRFTSIVDRDSTTVAVHGSIQGAVSMSQSWADSTLTLINNDSFRLGETITVSVNAGNSWGNYTVDSWQFSVKPDVDPPYYELIVLENEDIIPKNADFSFVFPGDIDTTSVDILLKGSVTGTVKSKRVWSDYIYTITPVSYLEPGETVTLRVNASDIYTNSIPETVHVFTVALSDFPWLIIDGITLYNTQTSMYRINYTVGDPDGDYTTTLGWQYSIDGGVWVDINRSNISGNDPHAPGDRSVFWTLPNTLQGVYSENVRFRMQITDGKFTSDFHESPPFKLDWNNVPAVNINSVVADYLTNRSVISYTVNDQENDTVSLLFEYSLDGGKTWITGTPGNDLSALTPDKYSDSFFWEFTQGLEPGIDYLDVRIRLTPSDYKTGTSSISEPYRINLNAPPSVLIDAIDTPQSEDVTIYYRLSDNENDTVRFICYYSVNEGLEWTETAHVSGADGITAYRGSIIWHSRMDIPVINSNKVRFRIEPWDTDKGTDDITDNFTLVNNGFPTIAVDMPESEGNVVSIPYLIDDPEKNPVTLHVMWSFDGQSWLPATVIGDTLDITEDAYEDTLTWSSIVDVNKGFFENILIRITATDEQNPLDKPGINFAEASFSLDNEAPSLVSATGFADGDTVYCSFSEPVEQTSSLNKENYTISHSLTILSVLSGNEPRHVMLILDEGQILPYENLSLSVTNIMDVFENISGEMHIEFLPENINSPPVIAVSIPDTAGNNVSIPFTIEDLEKNKVTLHVQWSFDSQLWYPATVLGDTLDIAPENYENTFTWLSVRDAGTGFFENMYIRVTATDKLNPPGKAGLHYAEAAFSLDNEAPSITSAFGFAESDTVYFSFNEPVDQENALNKDNYTLSTDLSVHSIFSGEGPQQYVLTLEEGQILPLDEVVLTITNIKDIFGNTGERSYVFLPEDINVPPEISINDIPPLVSGEVIIEYTVTDLENDPVNLAVKYSTDSGSTWNDATITGNVTGISPENYAGTFIWNSSDDIPGVYSENALISITASDRHKGEPALSNIFTVDNNLPPSIKLSVADPDSLYFETFTVSYILSDTESDTLSIQAFFSTDGGATYSPATVSGTVSGISQDGYSGMLEWDSAADFPEEYGTLVLKVIPFDVNQGFADSLSITVDNTGLSRVIITLPDGEQISEIQVEYHIYDNRNIDITLLADYSIDGGDTWNDATTDRDLSGLGPGQYVGTFQWLAQNDLNGYEGTALFRVIPRNDREGVPDSGDVYVDYNDPPVLTPVPIEGEVSGDVSVSYIAADTEADRVNITLLYSIDNRITWKEPALSGDIGNIVADGSAHSIIWHSVSDIPGRDIDDVWLQMFATDYDSGDTVETGPIHIDNNTSPSIQLTIADPDSTYGDFVDIGYVLSDAESDTLSLFVSYSIDGGAAYLPAAITGITEDITQFGYASSLRWEILNDLPDYYGNAIFKLLPSDNDAGIPDSLTIAINTYGLCSVSTAVSDIQDSTVTFNYEITDPKEHPVSLRIEYSSDNGASWNPAEIIGQLTDIPPAQYKGIFIWKSRLDIEGFDGNARIRITPNNGIDGTPSTQEVQVDYNEPPSIELVTAFTDSVYSGSVDMTVRASDVESDMVTVLVEFSLDGGSTYHHATLPDGSSVTPGIDAVISWLTVNDLGYVRNAEVILRITPKDSDPGEPVLSETFTVTNIVGDYNFDFVIDGNDLPGFIDTWNQQDLSKEIGPASGTVPDLIVQPDGKVDFEDLAVFVMMWNWYTEQAQADTIPRFKTIAENHAADIRLACQDYETIAVICDTRPDYMSLFVETQSNRETGVTVTEGSYWTVDNNGFVLSRPAGNNRFEIASGIFQDGSRITQGPFNLAYIRLNEELSENDVIRVFYKLRRAGETEIVEGTVLHTIDVDRQTEIPDVFSLLQNSPNPFNPSTKISFEIPYDARLTLSIYTIQGQLVTVLLDDFMKAGFHSYIWNAENMPSGLYFYSVKSDNYVKTKKMMLLK